MRVLKVLLLILFFFFCMIFFVQNTAILSTPLLLKMDVFSLSFTSPEVPFYVVLLLAFVVGGIFSLCYFVLEKMRMAGVIKTQAARIASLEKELAASKSYSGLSTGTASSYSASTYETTSTPGSESSDSMSGGMSGSDASAETPDASDASDDAGYARDKAEEK
ncbi:LapA family protein [Desulfovibrio sulfodismutans]|uniref:LapA family protein n=1 Tax=Desulfolutivibrio sulfodismutans TaxID=63561 RepID=A0A7K3NGP0_9BACT|nr:LapA family protein [Desulfolutivibrio sulfodismutans]NDY55361.1 LapA family protein [Desulfolutivibrio sulfodismutans]QLA11062.1 DUF1049 domain-containing protein [Desulfolutivibrio sulfodismutans DSM 3696]